jgi:PST family polysaccharide transporter
MEQMKLITILNVTAKSVFAILLFLVVRKPDDYIYVPVMNSMGFLTAALISAVLVTKKFGVKFIIPAFSVLGNRLRESSHFFLSRAAVSLYDNSNTFIIGLVLGNVSAGYYSAAEKLFKAMTALNMPLTNSLYPYMAKNKDVRTYRKIFSLATTGNVVFCLLVFLFSYQIVHVIYGTGFDQTATLLRFFAILASLMIPSVLLGYPLLAAMGHANYANYSVVAAACVHVLMLVAAIPVLSVKLVVVFLIITQLIVLTIRLVGVRRHLREEMAV